MFICLTDSSPPSAMALSVRCSYVKGVGLRVKSCTVLCQIVHRSSVFHLSVSTSFFF